MKKFDDGSGQESTDYKYDALDRLISVTIGDQQYRYQYDGFNRRLSKTKYLREDLEWKKVDGKLYLYDGQNEIGSCDEKRKILELRVLGHGKGAEIGATVAIELGQEVFAPIHDHNGNIVCLIEKETGEALEYYRYSAFGEEISSEENALQNPWRFSSKRTDPETNLVYFGRRYYEPRTGRWITQDPLGLSAGPNLFAYVMGNPLTHFDLYGLLHKDIGFTDEIMPTSVEDFNFARNAIGEGLIFQARNLCIAPDRMRSDMEATGNFIKTGKYEFNDQYYGATSSHFKVGTNDLASGNIWLHGCGMMNTLSQFKEDMENFSKNHDNVRMHCFHMPTQGFLKDTGKCTLWKLFGLNVHEEMVAEYEKYASKLVGQLQGDGVLVASLHSRGTQVGDQALDNLNRTAEGRRVTSRMDVLGIASAEAIPPGKAHYTHHYLSENEGLRLLPQYIFGMHGDNINYLKSNSIIDHRIDSEVYQKQMGKIYNAYK